MIRARTVAAVIMAIVVTGAITAVLVPHSLPVRTVTTSLTPAIGAPETITATVTTTALGWRFWHEYSGHAVFPGTGPAHSTIDFSPLTLPQEFYVSTISKPTGNIEWERPTVAHFYHYFGIQLNEGDRLPYAFRATAPIHFQIVFVNQTTTEFPPLIGLAYHPDQVLNDTIQSVGFGELVAQAKGLCIFVFEPLEAPNLTQSIAVIFSHYPIPVQWTTVTTKTRETVTVSLNQTVTTTLTTYRSIEGIEEGLTKPWPGPRLLPEEEMGDYPWLLRCGQLPDFKDEGEEWMWLGMLTKLADRLDGSDVPFWGTLVVAHGAGADGYYWIWIKGDKVREVNGDVIMTIVEDINSVAKGEIGFNRKVPVKFAEATGPGGYLQPVDRLEPVIEIIQQSKQALIFRPALINRGDDPVVIRHGYRLFDVRVYKDGVLEIDSTMEVKLCVIATATIRPGETYSGSPIVELRDWLNGPGRYRIVAWANFAPVEPLKGVAQPEYVGMRVERCIEVSD